MNGLATRSALVQAAEQAHRPRPRPVDFTQIIMAERKPRRRTGRAIARSLGLVCILLIILSGVFA